MRLAILLLLPLPIFAGSTPSSVALTSSKNPSTFGKSVTLTAKVKPTGATGTVTFYSGTTVLETEPLSEGKATLNTILLPFGTQPLKAYYGGDSTYAASTSAILKQTVNAVEGYGFQAVVAYPAGPGPQAVVVGDFNRDGRQDLAFADNASSTFEGGVSVLLGNGDGTFQAALSYPGLGPTSIATSDFNGDGIPDLVVANYNAGSVSVLLGNGDGTFELAVNYSTGGYARFVAAGDFNGDGKADLATADDYDNEVIVMLGNGDGTFRPPIAYTAGGSPESIAIGDFNGDGKTDLAVADYSPGYLGIMLGNGDGTFQTVVEYPAGSDLNSVASGDFNGDGSTDLAVTDVLGGVGILLGNGNGTFQTPVSYPAGNGPYSVTLGDFNGDGKADIAVADGNGGDSPGDVSILLGNGDGTFQMAVTYVAGSVPVFVGVGDFNGDGRADLAVADQQSAETLLATPTLESATILTASPNPSTYGGKVTVTARVSPVSVTGSVSFYSSTAALGKIEMVGGKATLSTAALPGGTDPLIAVYSGDSTYPKSISPTITQTVNRAATFTGLTSSPNPSILGQTVTFTATISSTTATGTVTFYHGSTALGTSPVTNGMGTLSVLTLPVGAHAITANYSGDGNYEGSTSPPWLQTVKAATTTTLTSSPNPSNLNQAVTLTATVSPATATGTVTFYHGTTSMGTGTLTNGIATLAVSNLSAGQHSLTATYGGDTNDAPSTSPAITQTVN